jgi:hypothetical protein
MKARFVLVAMVAFLLVPAAAWGQQTLAPPGKAGADQYFETVPSSAGNASPPTGSSSSGGARASAATLGALSRTKDGRAAASFAAASAPASAGHQGSGGASNGSAAGSTALRPLGGSDTGGLGIALPILLGTVTLVMVALAMALRRGRREAT